MLFPKDEKLSKAYVAGIIVEMTNRSCTPEGRVELQELMKKDHGIELDLCYFDHPKSEKTKSSALIEAFRLFGGFDVLDCLRETPQLTEEDVVDRWGRGYLAGFVMYIIGYLHMIQPPASVSRAVFVVENRIANHPILTDTIGKSDKVIWNAWADYKSVIHLWAANYFWMTKIDKNRDMPWAYNDRTILQFIGIANWFQGIGLSIIPKGSREPILDKGTIWKFPGQLRKNEIRITYEEEKWIAETLEKYSTPIRL